MKFNKTMMAGLVAATAMFAVPMTNVFADTTSSDASATGSASANTTTSATFTGGALSMAVTSAIDFGSATVANVYGSGFSGGSSATATVTDYTGSSNGWTLTAAQAANSWAAGTGGSADGVSVLNSNASVTVTSADDSGSTATAAFSATGDGNTISTTVNTNVAMNIDKGVAVKSGSYTSNVVWTLGTGTTSN